MALKESGAPLTSRQTERPWFAVSILTILVLALQFSPFIGLLAFRVSGNPVWSFVGVLRDFLVIFLSVTVLLQALLLGRRVPWNGSVAWAIVAIVLTSICALISGADLSAIALNLRRIIVFPLLFLAVSWANLTAHQITFLFRLILTSTVVVATFGIFEYLLPNEFWTNFLGVVEYFSANPLDPFGELPFEETGRFFSWDLQRVLGGPIRRSVSTYLEPTTLAAALAVGVSLSKSADTKGQRGAKLALFVCVVCGILTLSKGFFFFLLIGGTYLLLGIPSSRWLIGISIAACGVAALARAAGYIEGPFAHVAGLATAFEYLLQGRVLGDGLGMAGNYATDLADVNPEVGAESGLGNILAQCGLLAFFFVAWIQVLVVSVVRSSNESGRAWGRYLAWVILGWFVSFLFSASSLGIGGNSLVFLAAALFLHRSSIQCLKYCEGHLSNKYSSV